MFRIDLKYKNLYQVTNPETVITKSLLHFTHWVLRSYDNHDYWHTANVGSGATLHKNYHQFSERELVVPSVVVCPRPNIRRINTKTISIYTMAIDIVSANIYISWNYIQYLSCWTHSIFIRSKLGIYPIRKKNEFHILFMEYKNKIKKT